MKPISRYLPILLGLLLILGIVGIISPNVAAQQSQSIGVAPLRQEGTIDPGFVYSGMLLVKNSGTKPQSIDLSAETFNVINQTYDYLFKPGTTEANWVSFDRSSLSLAAGESTIVAYQVNVPIGTEPAGYYLALFALNRPAATTSGITPTERIASLLYLTVSGEATRSGKLIQLHSPIVVFGNTQWSATLQNSGTLHYRSTYSSSVNSIFDNQLGTHKDSRLILPGTVRLVEDSMPLPEILGLYKITYSVSLGDSPSRQETHWFLYLPPLQVILIMLIVAGVGIILRGRKKPNSSAEQRYK